MRPWLLAIKLEAFVLSHEHTSSSDWWDSIQWDANGLVPVIAQEQGTGDVLMFAWMNREALQKTRGLGRAVYFSRSRNKLWFKGEESGNVQTVHSIRLDCDADVVLLTVTQPHYHVPGNTESADAGQSVACHTGRHSCFYRELQGEGWLEVAPVLQDPQTMYGS